MTASATSRRSFRIGAEHSAHDLRPGQTVTKSQPRAHQPSAMLRGLSDDDPRLHRDAGADPAQPRALVARPEQARARARRRPGRAAARARQVLRDLLLEPRRVLHGARRRAPRPGARGRDGRLAGRPHAAAGARRGPRARARADGRAVEALARGALPRARRRGDPRRHRRRCDARRSCRSSSESSRARSTPS